MGSMGAPALILPLLVALSSIRSAQPKWDYGEGEQSRDRFLERPREPSDSQRNFQRDEVRGREEEVGAYRGRFERASEEDLDLPMEEVPRRRRSASLPRKVWEGGEPASPLGRRGPAPEEDYAEEEGQQPRSSTSLPRKIWNDFSNVAGDAYNGLRTGWRSVVPRFSQGVAVREGGAVVNRSLDSAGVRPDAAAVVEGQVLPANNAVVGAAAGGFAETRANSLRGDDDSSKTGSADSAMSSMIPGADGQLFGYSIWLWAAIGLGIAFCYLLCFIFKKQIPAMIRGIEIFLCEYLAPLLWAPFSILFWVFKKCFYPTKEIVMLSYKKCDYYYHPYKIVCKG